jgi:hypothetical protein
MAAPISRAGAQASDFPGLVTNIGPDAPAGAPGAAEEQTNLVCQRPGELRVRPGCKPVEYDAEE